MAKKKKILMLSDDLRMHSGVATQSKELVVNSIHKYDWVQIAGAIKHPEHGKVLDLSESINKELKNKLQGTKGYLKLYPTSGYGDPDMLRQIIDIEKPDAILHYTDPRFWIWLYQMENEIRQNIPIMYYNIWDDLPDPAYNTNYYKSSDLLMAISKQTYGINKRLLPDYEDWQIKYVPHGINEMRLKKIDLTDKQTKEEFEKFEQHYAIDVYKYKILYMNRNIRRKNPGDVLLSYKHFMDKLTPEERKECCFIFHSAPSDENGTDMRAVHQAMCPEYPIIFTYDKGGPMQDKALSFLLHTSSVYINLASNEGFGLGSLEALTMGTPIVVNVTGGLQDQCGFKNEKGEYLTAEDYVELGSNHTGKYKEHAEWVKPVWPTNRSLQGSPQTPYIFDDRASFEDAGEALYEWYKEGPEERERCGELGRQWVLSDDAMMTGEAIGKLLIESVEEMFEKWKPTKRYTMEVI
tara:strand:- start:9057 stop:10451 length:1395 start_codon:yes stop_codon:yes gene_type:complete